MGEIIYYINYTNEKCREYVTIPEKQLRFLIHTGNSNVIKTYVLLKYMCKNGEKRISRKYIATQIGLSPKSKSSLQTITDILVSLENNSFIHRRCETNSEDSKINTHIYYSVNSYEYRLDNYKKK